MVGRPRDAPMVTKSGYLHKRSFKGHKDVVNAFVSDDTRLFTASSDATIKVWAMDSGALLTTLEGHQQGVCCLALDGELLYSGSFDTTVLRWDLAEMRSTRAYRGHSEAVKGLVLREKWLLSASRDKTVRVWNESSGKCIAILRGHTAPVLCLAGQDRLLYTGSDDCSVRQWDWLSGAQMREYNGHTDGVTDIKIAGDHLLSASFDASARLWDIKSGQCVRICKADAGLRGLEIATGKVFGAGNNAQLYIWDLNSTRSEPLAADRIARGGLTMVTVDGNTVLAASADNIVRLWEKVSASTSHSAITAQGGALGGAGASAATIKHDQERANTFPPGANKYIGGLVEDAREQQGSEDEAEGERNGKGAGDRAGASGDERPFNVFEGVHADKVHGVCIEGDRLLCCSSDKTVSSIPLVADAASAGRGTITRLSGHEDRVLALAAAAGSGIIFSASADGTIKKWELASGRCLDTLVGHTDWVSCLVVSDGALFSGSWDASVRKWDLSTSRFIAQLAGHLDPVHSLAAAPGVVFSGSRDCTIRAWRSDGCESLRVYEGHSAAVSALVVHDPLLFSASWDRTVRVWDMASGRRLRVLPTLPQPILCLALFNNVLLAGGADRKVHALDPGTGAELLCLESHSQAVTALCVLDSRVFSASDDASVAEWRPTCSGPAHKSHRQESANLADRIAAGGGDTANVVSSARVAGSLASQLTTEAQFLTQTGLDEPSAKESMQGWLLKQGAVLRRWTRRFYRLDRGVLSYYPDDKSPRALDSVLLLSPSGVAGAERDEAGALGVEHGFTLRTAQRELRLAAGSAEELDAWLAALEVYAAHAALRARIASKKLLRKY